MEQTPVGQPPKRNGGHRSFLFLKFPGGQIEGEGHSGTMTALIFVCVVGFLGLGVIQYFGLRDVARAQDAAAKSMMVEIRSVREDHMAILNTTSDTNCLASIPFAEKAAAMIDPNGPCHYMWSVYIGERAKNMPFPQHLRRKEAER
jgi:hypothetical protein